MTKEPDILRRFSGVRRSGDGWSARCPAHEDRKASLSIHERDGKILLHCHAGCPTKEVCRAAGIEFADLFLDGAPHPKSQAKKVVAAYDYIDAGGTLIFQVLRFAPKEFKQRRPDGQGGWLWNLDGVPRVVYRLPEVLSASEALLVEGEKDAETGRALGFVATCNPGGAGKWRSEYSEALAGKDVIVIPDQDDTGRKHGQQVLTSLEGKARSLKLVELPDVKDLTEWVERGGTREQLVDLIRSAPEWTPPNGVTLLREVIAVIRSYVFLSPAQALIVALWVFHTHAFSAADATPYLSITSVEKQSGKSRLLEVLELLVSEPWLTGRVTPAVLVRRIDKHHPTLLLDESDAAFKENDEYAEALRGVLNTGHRRSGKASCCVGQGANIDFKDFETFCPKALAGIGRLPDTVADRSIPVRLKRRTQDEEIKRFRRRKAALEAEPIKQRIFAWAASAAEKLKNTEPDLPEGLTDRQQDCAEPLIAIADSLGGDLQQRARAALLELFSAGAEEDDQSVGVRLLEDLRAIFEEEEPTDKLASETLVERLGAIETSPWAEWSRGKPLTKVQLARLLKRFGITPRNIRLRDGSTLKGYVRDDFKDSWERYLPGFPSAYSPSKNATSPQTSIDAGSEQTSKRHNRAPVANQKVDASPAITRGVAGVAVQEWDKAPVQDNAPTSGHAEGASLLSTGGNAQAVPSPGWYRPEALPAGAWRCECGAQGDDPTEWSKHTGMGGCPLKASPSEKPSKHDFGKAQTPTRREG